MSTCVQVPGEVEEEASDYPKLRLEVIVNNPMWMLETELRSSGRVTSTLNH